MSCLTDGGSAFPFPGNMLQDSDNGMSLRDWFAGQALPAIVEAAAAGQHHPTEAEGLTLVQAIAQGAYELADAMLEASQS